MKILKFVLSSGILLSIFLVCSSAQTLTPDPKEQEALFVAKKAFEDGFYDVSLQLLGRFLKNYPVSNKASEANLLIGQCYFHQSKYLEALEKFNELQNDPLAYGVQDAVIYWTAEVHFKGNNFIKAAQYYERLTRDFPKSSYLAPSLYSLGWCLFQERDFKSSMEYFKTVEEKYPKEPYAHDASVKIAECLYNLKEYASLKEKLKNYIKIFSKDKTRVFYFYFYSAEADYYLDNFSEAIQEYSLTLANTDDVRIKTLCLLGLGWSNLKLKQYKEAERNFSDIKPEDLEKSNLDVLDLGKALLLAENKSFGEAKKIYRGLISSATQPLIVTQAYLGLADAAYNTAEYKEAIGIYREALTKVSASIPQELIDKLHYGLAWAFLKDGEFKAGIEEFRKLVKLSGDKIVKVSALCQIGDAYQDSGDFKKAIETYDSILKNYPDSFYSDYVQYQLGAVFLKTTNYDSAIMSFKTLKKNFPDSKLLDDATYALGLAYFQGQDYNSSKDVFERFQNEFKDSNLKSQAMYLQGTSLYNLGRFNEAIEVFKDITRQYNHDEELLQKCEYEIADCFYQLGNEKEAMDRFKALRSKYPDSKLTCEVIWWLGEYYFRHNELNLSRRYFSTLIRDFPRSSLVPDAYYALGVSFAEESAYEEAVNNFKKVIESSSSDFAGTAAIAIADIQAKQEKFDLALETYKRVLNDYQNLAHLVYPKAAEVYYKMKKYDEAIDYYSKSLDLVPLKEMSGVQFRIAEIRQAQGKYEEAIGEYLKVTYLYAENSSLTIKSLLRVASIYEDKENFKEALNIYNKIIQMNVDEAKFAKERIDWIEKYIK